MLQLIKAFVRDLLPTHIQVPVKYWYSKLTGSLEDELVLLSRILTSTDTVIDVGANRGVYAFIFARICGQVELFEPNKLCAELLFDWASNYSHVNVHQLALSDRLGSTELYIPLDSSGTEHDASATIEENRQGPFRKQLVPLATLDSYTFSNIAFIKIDVEGHEHCVLKGAHNTLVSHKPALLIEIEKRHLTHPFTTTFDYLKNIGYQAFFLDSGRLLSFNDFDLNRHQCIENLGSKSSLYINNFLFLHSIPLRNGTYSNLFLE